MRPHYQTGRGLTPKHLAIIRTLAIGFNNSETAEKHGVSVTTVVRVRTSKPGRIELPKAIEKLAQEEFRAVAVRTALMLHG